MDYSQPTDEFIRSIDVHELLPQQEPFVMIGRLTHFDMEHITAETTVADSNLFLEDGQMLCTGLMENIAQTCAARIGYINKYILHKEITAGVIGAVKTMKMFRAPNVGDTIVTEIEVLEEIFNILLVKAEIWRDDETIAVAEIKMAI